MQVQVRIPPIFFTFYQYCLPCTISIRTLSISDSSHFLLIAYGDGMDKKIKASHHTKNQLLRKPVLKRIVFKVSPIKDCVAVSSRQRVTLIRNRLTFPDDIHQWRSGLWWQRWRRQRSNDSVVNAKARVTWPGWLVGAWGPGRSYGIGHGAHH